VAFFARPRNIAGSLMKNDQIKLLCLGIISGCGLIALALANSDARDAQGLCVIVTLASLIWFIMKYNSIKA
jgi:hypothetical protein